MAAMGHGPWAMGKEEWGYPSITSTVVASRFLGLDRHTPLVPHRKTVDSTNHPPLLSSLEFSPPHLYLYLVTTCRHVHLGLTSLAGPPHPSPRTDLPAPFPYQTLSLCSIELPLPLVRMGRPFVAHTARHTLSSRQPRLVPLSQRRLWAPRPRGQSADNQGEAAQRQRAVVLPSQQTGWRQRHVSLVLPVCPRARDGS